MLRTSDLDYELPERFIATHAVEPRDAARMMVVHRSAGHDEATEQKYVRDLPAFLRAGDLLVLNTTRVMPARLVGVRVDTGAHVQGLYLGPGSCSGLEKADLAAAMSSPLHTAPNMPEPILWHVLLKMRRFRAGTVVSLIGPDGETTGVLLRLIALAPSGHDGATGGWIVAVERAENNDYRAREWSTDAILRQAGHTPLPPYILSARKRHTDDAPAAGDTSRQTEATDRERYQTVYADATQNRSVAAPTAGLHFTPELLQRLSQSGVQTARVLLHVGMGTFKPVETEFVEQHPMHQEWCCVPRETAAAVLETRRRGGRVIAVGTTAARTLESFDSLDACDAAEFVRGHDGYDGGVAHETKLLITPGYCFRHVDGMLTNFHLPRSTLLAMAAAMLGDSTTGVRRLMACYHAAMDQGYRFYSFGDAMLILP